MEAQYYSDRSIAVFGDSEPWKENLKQLGGRFNRYLDYKDQNGNIIKTPGWIFPKSKESAIVKFINDANANAIKILPPQPPSPLLATVYPSQPPTQSPSQPPSRRVVSKTKVVKSVKASDQHNRGKVDLTPTKVSFPNMFVGADNLNYQIILYTVVMPSVNQLFDIQVGDQILNYKVITIEKQEAPFDSIIVAPVDNNETLSRAVVINGRWKIEGMDVEHSLIFK